MRDREREPVEWGIADQFARWATRNAVHDRRKEEAGGVDTSQCAVNARLDSIDFARVFDGSLGAISDEDFEAWHVKSVELLMGNDPNLSYAWAAKYIAIYLKVTCYLAGFGREGLKDAMYPPFDRELFKALSRETIWKDVPSGLGLTHIATRKDYDDIIQRMMFIASQHRCTLFEVDQFWSPPK